VHTCDWRSTVVVGDKRQASVAQRPSLALHGVIDVSNKQGQRAFSRPATHRDVVSASFCAFDEQTLSRLKGDKKHRLHGIVCIYILRAPAGLLHKDIDILRTLACIDLYCMLRRYTMIHGRQNKATSPRQSTLQPTSIQSRSRSWHRSAFRNRCENTMKKNISSSCLPNIWIVMVSLLSTL